MLDQFVEMTRQIIRDDGFEDYLPTLVLPGRQEIFVLEADLAGDDHEQPAREFALGHLSGAEDYLLAFKKDRWHFKVVGRIDGRLQERVCEV